MRFASSVTLSNLLATRKVAEQISSVYRLSDIGSSPNWELLSRRRTLPIELCRYSSVLPYPVDSITTYLTFADVNVSVDADNHDTQ